MPNACRPCRRTARMQALQCRQYPAFVLHGGGFQYDPGRTGVDDDRHRIFRLQLVEQQSNGLFHQRQLVGAVHGARDIQQEYDIGFRPAAGRQVISLDADIDQLVAGFPGGIDDRDVGAERNLLVARAGIVVIEIIHHLFQPYRILLRQIPVVQLTSYKTVGGRVDIDRECRNRIFGRHNNRVRDGALKPVAANIMIGRSCEIRERRCHHRRPGLVCHGAGQDSRAAFRMRKAAGRSHLHVIDSLSRDNNFLQLALVLTSRGFRAGFRDWGFRRHRHVP